MKAILRKRFIRGLSGTITHARRYAARFLKTLPDLPSRLFAVVKRPYSKLAASHPVMRTYWFRAVLHFSVILLIVSPLYAVLDYVLKESSYKLNNVESALLSVSTVDDEYIKQTDTAISYNRADEAVGDEDLQAVLTLAANKEDATGKKPYQAALSKDAKQGITFSDSEGSRSVSLTPVFQTGQGRLQEGRVIYPASITEKHIYSFKNNGIKSDILLTRAPAVDTKAYSWDLGLDSTLEARMLPGGGVGIYSADPNLYGNLQIADEKSQTLINKARTSAPKNTLVFEMPAPFILDANNQTSYQNVSYKLGDDGKTLTLEAKNLKSLAYPLTIDPTITVTTTSDFAQGTGDTGNTDFSTSGEIRRTPADSGAVGATIPQAGAFTNARSGHTSVQYNGYMYITGGYNGGSNENDIQYCELTSDGSAGACTRQTNAFTGTRTDHTSVVYNGYLYIIGGSISGVAQNDIQHCKILADHSVDTCTQQTAAFTTARYEHASVAHGGYLYIIGGTNGTSPQDDVLHCSINADGSVGACVQEAAAFATARYGHTSVVSDGYLYVIGGVDGGGTELNDIQYCLIDTDGSVGACTQQASAFTGVRMGHSTVMYGGYLYIIGGTNGVSPQNDIQYCPLNTNGSVGSCTQQTAAFTTARDGHASIAYKGYLYVIGGGSYNNDVQRLLIGPPAPFPSRQTGAFTAIRYGQASVASNGFLYVVGGVHTASNTTCNSVASNYCSDIQYCPLNSNGSVGVCTVQAGAFTNARSTASVEIYDGYLYIIGGKSASYYNDIQYCPINTNGSVGTCTVQAGAFTAPRASHESVIYKGYLYIIGGKDLTIYYNDIQLCPINTDHTVGVCSQKSSAFTTGRSSFSTAVYNDYLYIIGGTDTATTVLNDIQYCPINVDYSVGACITQTNAFTVARRGHTSFLQDGLLYIIGGDHITVDAACNSISSAFCSDIQYCQINTSTHAVGACDRKTSAFTTGRYFHSSAVYNGYFYIIGGYDGTEYNDIQYAQIGLSGGEMSTFTTDSTSYLAIPRRYHTSVAYNGYIYVIGGYHDTSDTLCKDTGIAANECNDVTYAAINPDGTLGAFTAGTTPRYFAFPRRGHTSVAYNGYLYVIGGWESASDVNCKNGGSGTYCNDVQYAAINSDGSLGAFTSGAVPSYFAYPRYGHTSITYNGYLYIIGGYRGVSDANCKNTGVNAPECNDVQYAAINSDGSLGAFTSGVAPSYFAYPRYNHTSVAYNGYIYIIGGTKNASSTACKNTGVASTECNDVQYAAINSDGSLGAFTSGAVPSYFAYPRFSHASVAYNGHLYVIGGTKVTSDTWCKNNGATNASCNDIQYAAINSDGSLGAFTTDSSSYFAYPRYYHSSVVDGGNLYIVGGLQAVSDVTCKNSGTSTLCSDVQYALLAGVPSKARYERIIDTGSAGNNITSLTVNGTTSAVPCAYTVTYKSAGSDYIYGAATTLAKVPSGVPQTLNLTDTRYILVAISMDDTTCGGLSTVTSIALLYNAAPDAPALLAPANNATSVSILPEFRLGSADDSNDYLAYKMEVCNANDCNPGSVVRTIDQTSSQTGWLAQGAQSGTAYTGGLPLTQYAIHKYQPLALSANTQYWWRAQALDSGGSNQWSSYSLIYTFTTTTSATPNQINIGGGVTINGNTKITTGN